MSEKLKNPSRNYHQETLQYPDGQLALKITGESGEVFDWEHKWSPSQEGEAILTTQSGNSYFIHNGHQATYIVNMGETARLGKPVAAISTGYPTEFPPVEFGTPWEVPGFVRTTPVQSVLLRYKVATEGNRLGTAVQEEDPFKGSRAILKQVGFVEDENGFYYPIPPSSS